MRKCYVLLTVLLCSYGINAQVGINTDNPQATLDVQKSPTAGKAMGIIPPRVTGEIERQPLWPCSKWRNRLRYNPGNRN